MRKGYKRSVKNFFLKKDLQGKLILSVFLSGLGGCISIILLLAFFSADTLTISYDDSTIQMGQTPFMLFKNALAANWIFVVLGGTLLVLAAMIGTHRIAGPLFHLENALGRMANKNLSDHIVLRKKDECKKIAQQINTFNITLSGNLHEIKKCSQSIEQLIRQYESCRNSSLSREELEMLFQSIQNKNNKIQETLNLYTLANG